MLAMITGAGGFVGSHLTLALRQLGRHVVPLDHQALDVTRRGEVERVFQENRPDEVYHLAAQSSASRSWTEPSLTYQVNVVGTHNVLEAVRRHSPSARVLISASSDVYGAAGQREAPSKESQIPRPLSPYAVSKLGQEAVALMFHEAFGIHTLITRAFMHIGPGQPSSFATADWARQVALAEAGLSDPIVRVGDIEVVREFIDVRDIVGAYINLLEAAEPGSLCNVASGKAYPLKDVLAVLLGLSRVELEVEVDSTRIRAADPRTLVGDPTRLRRLTDWTPRYSLEETLADILDYWRGVIAS